MIKTIKAMPETDINVDREIIVINQNSNYRTETITIPVAMWAYISALIEEEIANPTKE